MLEMLTVIDYGQSQLQVDIPAEKLVPLVRPAPGQSLTEPIRSVEAALESPHEYPPLRSALTPDDHLVIVIDPRLPCLAELVTAILRHAAAAGVEPGAVRW